MTQRDQPSGTSFTPPEDMMIVEQGRPSAEARELVELIIYVAREGSSTVSMLDAAKSIDALCAARVAEATGGGATA